MAKVMRAVVKPSESGAMGNFVEGSGGEANYFTQNRSRNMTRNLPNHNPPQPERGLPMGAHTHAAARDAVHSVTSKGPAMTYTGMLESKPAAEQTPKSRANRNDRKVSMAEAVKREMPKSGGNKDY